jgi:hypothetical protein
MLNYLADVILLAVICSIPYLVSRVRLQSSRSRKPLYEFAQYIPGMPLSDVSTVDEFRICESSIPAQHDNTGSNS